MKFEVKIEGQPTAEKIRAAPDLLKKYLLGAFMEGATDLAQAAGRGVRSQSGELAGSFAITVREKGDTYSVRVGPKAYYAGWVESGHLIGKRGGAVAAKLRRRLHIADAGPRVPARPYFAPAVEALRGSFSAAINAAIARAEAETQGDEKAAAHARMAWMD